MTRHNGSSFRIEDKKQEGTTVFFTGKLDVRSAPDALRSITEHIERNPPGTLVADLANVSYLDDFGVLVLDRIRKTVGKKGGRFLLRGTGEKAGEILSLFNFEGGWRGTLKERQPRAGLMVSLGKATLDQIADLRFQIAFMGSVLLAFLTVVRHPGFLRLEDTVASMKKTGVDAFPIVALISFLLGLIMAFMSSVQLQQFGANIYVASLVSLAMVRELGPIMTSIIVAGRSGSAFASEIATMKISEEVDALFTMGFDVTRFLVVPKVLASILVVPLLSVFSNLFAILGGLVVGVSMLDLTANAYMTQTFKTLRFFYLWFGLFKSGFFALLIAWMGCLRGFQASGGASAVGKATTSAVVSSIFLIILWDSIFAVIIRYWG
jgi:phospholipid/cholesterol/gamma-HCH transport system permease protein